jgi:AbrB family looped-hinge helix DNA binding protein
MNEKEIVTMSTKGQVTLPNEFREELKIDKGSKMVVLIKQGWIFMKPISNLSKLRGILSEAEKTSEELIREIRGEWDKDLEGLI